MVRDNNSCSSHLTVTYTHTRDNEEVEQILLVNI